MIGPAEKSVFTRGSSTRARICARRSSTIVHHAFPGCGFTWVLKWSLECCGGHSSSVVAWLGDSEIHGPVLRHGMSRLILWGGLLSVWGTADQCAIFRSIPPGLGPHGVYNGSKGIANSVPLSPFILSLTSPWYFHIFAYFILLELHCISNSFIFFPLSLIHLIFNPLLPQFPSHGGPLRGKTGW